MPNGDHPRVYLAVDNCFASKRWTRPSEWAALCADMGVTRVEASADTECDPLYMGPAFLRDWAGEVRRAAALTGVAVANLYSGHGTYATTGLSHHDGRVRDRIQHEWVDALVDAASGLGAGVGFFCHAFSQNVLSDPARYAAAMSDLVERLGAIAAFAAARGCVAGVEQMYTPHQPPWTIAGAERMLAAVLERSGAPIFLTIDTGHQLGQRKFLRPEPDELEQALHAARAAAGGARSFAPEPWLGCDAAYDAFARAVSAPAGEALTHLAAAAREMDLRPYLFSAAEDCDPYAWLRRLGAWSPIVHLQQVVGDHSAHAPFTERNNRVGTITPARVLAALADSFARPAAPGMPEKVREVHLTLEIFAGTADRPRDILRNVRESVEHWRPAVPEDGAALDELVPADGAD